MISYLRFGCLLGCFSLAIADDDSPHHARLIDPQPEILVLLLPGTLINIDSALNSANRAFLEAKVREVKSAAELNPENERLKKALQYWKSALKDWKRGCPLSGVARVIIVEQSENLCVAYFPDADAPFVCYLGKGQYDVRKIDSRRMLKAENLNQNARNIE